MEVHTSKLANYFLVKYFHCNILEQNITSLKLVCLQSVIIPGFMIFYVLVLIVWFGKWTVV